MTLEPVEDWRIPCLVFLEQRRLPDNPAQRIEIKRRATKFVLPKKCVIPTFAGWDTPPM